MLLCTCACIEMQHAPSMLGRQGSWCAGPQRAAGSPALLHFSLISLRSLGNASSEQKQRVPQSLRVLFQEKPNRACKASRLLGADGHITTGSAGPAAPGQPLALTPLSCKDAGAAARWGGFSAGSRDRHPFPSWSCPFAREHKTRVLSLFRHQPIRAGTTVISCSVFFLIKKNYPRKKTANQAGGRKRQYNLQLHCIPVTCCNCCDLT